jgi:hypothetical protein
MGPSSGATVRRKHRTDPCSRWNLSLANQFDNCFTDIFSTQDAISEQVVKALEIELTGEEHKRLISRETEWISEAYRLYIMGRSSG